VNPNAAKGTIYYTYDYQDPRSIGGAKVSSAMNGGNAAELTINETTVIKARVWNGDTCSALHEITLYVDPSINTVDSSKREHPNIFMLFQNYPNPFNPDTRITFELPRSGLVTLKVYDILGREVAILENKEKPSGIHVVHWNALAMPSGVYFYKLQAGNHVETKIMTLIK
jgi:hypothetical protein